MMDRDLAKFQDFEWTKILESLLLILGIYYETELH